MTVDRLLSRASSTPQFTAIVVVPAPPLAPKNTSVVAGGCAPCAVSRRAAVRRIAPWNVSSAGGQVKNSLAPARIACRISSGSAASATAKMPAPGAPRAAARCVAIADDASPRVSTMTTSGAAPVARARSSSTLTGIAPERSRRPRCFLKSSSSRDDESDELCHGYCYCAFCVDARTVSSRARPVASVSSASRFACSLRGLLLALLVERRPASSPPRLGGRSSSPLLRRPAPVACFGAPWPSSIALAFASASCCSRLLLLRPSRRAFLLGVGHRPARRAGVVVGRRLRRASPFDARCRVLRGRAPSPRPRHRAPPARWSARRRRRRPSRPATIGAVSAARAGVNAGGGG